MTRNLVSTLALLTFSLLLASMAFADASIINVYDANGNLVSGDGNYYEYNDANQLVRVRQGDQNGTVISEYFYDYSGQRIKKIENGITTYYVGQHYEQQVGGGTTTTTNHYFADGERVARKDVVNNSAALYYYHLNHLDSTTAITDSAGNLYGSLITYTPFGEIKETSGTDKYSFTGKEKDKTSLYYFDSRYNHPEFRHFTQADIAEPDFDDPQDLNRYSYVGNNPLTYIDIDGYKKHKKKHLSRREQRARALGLNPDKDKYWVGKLSHKAFKTLEKKHNEYVASLKTVRQTHAYSSIASGSRYNLSSGGMCSVARAVEFNRVQESKNRYGFQDSVEDMLSADEWLAEKASALALSSMKAWHSVEGLSEFATYLDLGRNIVGELGGIKNIGQAWQHAWENVTSASGDEWLDAITHSTASITAISINTVLSPLNATLRLVSGGSDLTLSGDDVINGDKTLLGD